MSPKRSLTLPAVAEPVPAEALASGARSGAVLGVASAASIVANYVFLLAAGRILGSEDYGSLAALLGLLAVVLIPTGALQMAVSRDISRLVAAGQPEQAEAFARRMVRVAAVGTLPLIVLAFSLAAPFRELFNIGSIGVVLLAETALVTALLAPVAMGVLQGRQRFHALALVYVAPFVLRLGVLAIAAVLGYGLGGAVFASVVSAIAGTLLALVLIREPRRAGDTVAQQLRPFLRYLVPVLAGLIGIGLLTHLDILVVKARFSADDAGAYAAASAFARVGYFLPATILAVLFPRTAARHARGEDTEDILGRSLLVTAAFCGALALFYAAAGVGLISTTFGPDFAKGGTVLAVFALAIGLFSLANVLVGYHLSRGETRYAWIVAGGVVVQLAVLALVPSSLAGVVWTNVAIGAALLAAHELFVESSAPAVRAGLAHFSAHARVRLRRLSLEAVLVLSSATAFVCLLFWPVVAHFGSTVIGPPAGDSTGAVWWLWQLHQEGYHVFGTTHHVLTGAPFGWNEGNGLNLQWLLPYYPAYLATGVFGELATLNLTALAGFVLSGATMYGLVRYLGCGRLVASWAALVYIVFPRHLVHAQHASIVHIEVLALLMLALVAVARRPSWPRFAFVGIATLACWLTFGYYGVFAVVSVVAFSVGAALAATRHRAAILFGSTVAALVPSLLMAGLSVVSGVGRGAGLNRAAGDLSIFGIRPLELVVPANQNLIFGARLQAFHDARLHGANPTETTNYLGLLTIALALCWLAYAWSRRKTLASGLRSATAGLMCVFIAGLVLSAPSPYVVFGHEIWMPSRVLWEIIPAIRVPSRWDLLLMTALLPLAALGLQRISSWLEQRDPFRRRIPVTALVAVLVAATVSFLELTVSPAQPRYRVQQLPAQYVALARTPPGILAEYPLIGGYDYLFWQRRHHRRLLNLNGGTGTRADSVRRMLVDPSAPGTAQTLALLGVTAIITDAGALDFTGAADIPDANWGPGYKLVARLPDHSSVWQVVATPASALVTLAKGFGDPMIRTGRTVVYPLVQPSGDGDLELTARMGGVVRLYFDASPGDGRRRLVRISDGANQRVVAVGGRTHVSLRVQVPRGRSRLFVRAEPFGSGDGAVFLTAPRAAPASGRADLHAQLITRRPGF